MNKFMSSLIDSHSHIQFPAYDQDRDAVILRSREAGVKMIAVGTQASTSEDAIRVAEQYLDDVIGATVGFHPNHLDVAWHHDKNELTEAAQEVFDIDRMRELVKHPRVVAIGECGLDYYRIKNPAFANASAGRDEEDIKKRQKEVFIQQIELACEVKKPLIIHCRSAFGNLISILDSKFQILNSSGAGVVHFFSGTVDDARKLLDLGFYLGFGGVITFVRDYDEVVKYAPLDRILLETDAPYVAPIPYRGKRNEPAYVVEVAKKFAEFKNTSHEKISEQTTKNTVSLFGLS